MPESSTGLVPPHGGHLNERLVLGDEAAQLAERARSLPQVTLDPRQVTDVELLAVGALSPLDGFMNEADYNSVIDRMRLASGLTWSVPITLGVARDEAQRLVDSEVALVTPDGTPLAIIRNPLHLHDCVYCKRSRAASVYEFMLDSARKCGKR